MSYLFYKVGHLAESPFASPSPKGDVVQGSLENRDGFVSFSLLIHETPQKPYMFSWEQGERDYVHLTVGELGCQEVKCWCRRVAAELGTALALHICSQVF